MKILLLGPRINKDNPLIIGGAITAFEELVNQLKLDKIDYILIDTNKKNYTNIYIAYIYILYASFIKQKECTHISLHSSKDYIFFGLFIILLGKIFHKKTSLRKFGGEALQVYMSSKWIKKKILYLIFKNFDIIFFEIKYIVQFFLQYNNNCYWFPNTRNRELKISLPRQYKKRFVFMSHVNCTKGINEILEVSMLLDKSYTIDIFGLITDEKYTKEYMEKFNVSYCGILSSKQVIEKLDTYDVLLLPSYKEGYPGIIIESYSLGIPCITTFLESLKEIVDDYQTGILVEPKSTSDLYNAIIYFDKKVYKKMSKNAYKKFDIFDSSIQSKLFLNRLLDV